MTLVNRTWFSSIHDLQQYEARTAVDHLFYVLRRLEISSPKIYNGALDRLLIYHSKIWLSKAFQEARRENIKHEILHR